MKITKMVLIIVFMLSSTFIISACANQNESESPTKAEIIEKASFEVTGMTCVSCSFVVKSAIQGVKGVQNVNVKSTSTTGVAQVEFDKSKTDIKAIKQSVLDLGFGFQ